MITNKRLWLAKFVLLGASVAIGFSGIEAIVRVSGSDRPLMWQPDPELGWWHIPGSKQHWLEEGDGWVEINSLGLRDVERTIAKPPGVFRIAVFGDSMTEAVQVNLEQTFCQLLEARLRALGLYVEVLNFGVSGYSPLQEYLLYKRIGRAYAPDLVLHAVFLDNDIADGDPELAAGQGGAPFVAEDPVRGVLIDRSRAEVSDRDYRQQPLSTVRRLSATYRAFSAARWNMLRSASFRAGMASNEFVPRRYLLYADPIPQRWQMAWNTFERIVSMFDMDVRAEGAKYVLVSVPAGQLVYDKVWSDLLGEYPAMTRRRWQLLRPENYLKELAAAHNLTLIAPLEIFRQGSSQAPLFFGRVGHMTSRGHEIMAATLADSLIAHQLLPAAGQITMER